MNRLVRPLAAAAGTLLPLLTASAQSFEDVSRHLDTDGSVVFYADFRGDGRMIGRHLNAIYRHIRNARQDLPPIPLDFPSLFDALGLGSIGAIAGSSATVEDGLFRNRMLVYPQGESRGLLRLGRAQPLAFEAARLAPADAHTVVSGTISLEVVRDTILDVAGQIAGPMGQETIRQALAQPLPGASVTADEVITALSGPVHGIMGKLDLSGDMGSIQNIDYWLRFDEAGPVLIRLLPLLSTLDDSGIVVEETDAGVTVTFALPDAAPTGLSAFASRKSPHLELFSSPEFRARLKDGSPRLADQPQFRRLAAHLPEKAYMFSYTAGADLDPILEQIAANVGEDATAYLPVLKEVLALFAGNTNEPSATASTVENGVMIYDTYSGTTYRRVLGTLTVIPAAIGGGIATAAFQKIQAATQAAGQAEADLAIEANLHSIVAAATQYFIDNPDATEVGVEQLLSAGYLGEFESVQGEYYLDLVLYRDDSLIGILTPNGGYVDVETGFADSLPTPPSAP